MWRCTRAGARSITCSVADRDAGCEARQASLPRDMGRFRKVPARFS